MRLKNVVPIMGAFLTAGLVFAAATFLPSAQPFGYIAPAAISDRNVANVPVAYVPRFEFENYSGDLIAAEILTSGEINLLAPKWKAAEKLDDQDWDDERFIVTLDDEGNVVPFRKDDMSDDQVDTLKKDEKERIKFLRGKRDKEGDKFRNRNSVLGDIIHSNPVYVGPSKITYNFDNHADFVASNKSRNARVYVGANDGMLHAFDAADGEEVFAYVPSVLIPKMKAYADEEYTHDYFVDGPLTSGDAFFNSSWSTVLIGALGAGGKTVFGLDITQASPIVNEGNGSTGAGSKVMWEFTDQSVGGDNLGYTYSRASIVKANNGQFAAVTGNGYLSGTGKASLIMLDLATGTVMREIVVNDADANGLSTPSLVDINGDRKADYAYAGDLNGNVWKFDLTSTLAAEWHVSYSGTPLFTATSKDGVPQAITSTVDVARHPQHGVLVYFGTGRLLADSEATDVTEQAVYGIWDFSWNAGDLPFSSSDLLAQTLTDHTHSSGARVRTASNNAPNWSTHRGWRLSLESTGSSVGERVIQDISISNGRINISSLNPSVANGENWLLQVNANTGGAPSAVVFDLDGDGNFDKDDNVDGDGNSEVTDDPLERVVGLYKGFGLISRSIEAQIAQGIDVVISNQLSGIDPTHTDSTGPGPDVDPGDDDYGLVGGHMDLDVASQTYAIDNGATDNHKHEWDNSYGTIVDFFAIDAQGGFRTVDGNSDLPGSDENGLFIINMVNAGLSPAAILEINDIDFPVIEWQGKVKRFLTNTQTAGEFFPVFMLGEPSAAQLADGIIRLNSLKMKFAADAITVGGLHPTATGCVKGNDESPNGEYRNGALTTQLLDASALTYSGGKANPLSVVHSPAYNSYETSSFAIHDEMNYAVPPIGKSHGSSDGMHWESILFWHWGGGCYSVDKADDYASNYEEIVGVEDTRTHDGEPTGNYVDPYADPDPDPEPDDTTVIPGDPREENSEHTTSSDQVSSTGRSGRLYWREWVPDND